MHLMFQLRNDIKHFDMYYDVSNIGLVENSLLYFMMPQTQKF